MFNRQAGDGLILVWFRTSEYCDGLLQGKHLTRLVTRRSSANELIQLNDLGLGIAKASAQKLEDSRE